MAAARSIASLSLSFGLVSIQVRLFSATESAAAIRLNLLASDGSRLEQQYVSKSTGKKVERVEMTKFVVFTPDELKALEERENASTLAAPASAFASFKGAWLF